MEAIAQRHTDGTDLDGVLIELTGVADPAPIIQTFLMVPEVSAAFYVDNVVALVDAQCALDRLDEHQHQAENGTASAQIAFASTVLLNKIDLASEARLGEIECRIREINSTVAIIRCRRAQVPVSNLIGIGIFDLGRVLQEQYMDEDEFKLFYKPQMDASVSNVGIRCDKPVNVFAVERFLDNYLGAEELAKDFLRVKAVLNVAGSDRKFVIQAVHMTQTVGFVAAWAEEERRDSRIIFIGRNMQERRQALQDGFHACIAKPLRFDIGSGVKVQVGCTNHHDHSHEEFATPHGHWEGGHVVKHWDECNAYKVRLLRGEDIQVPLDDDGVIVGTS